MTPNGLFLHSEQHIVQPPSETLPSAADENKYGEPQLDSEQGVRELGAPSPKWDGSI